MQSDICVIVHTSMPCCDLACVCVCSEGLLLHVFYFTSSTTPYIYVLNQVPMDIILLSFYCSPPNPLTHCHTEVVGQTIAHWPGMSLWQLQRPGSQAHSCTEPWRGRSEWGHPLHHSLGPRGYHKSQLHGEIMVQGILLRISMYLIEVVTKQHVFWNVHGFQIMDKLHCTVSAWCA